MARLYILFSLLLCWVSCPKLHAQNTSECLPGETCDAAPLFCGYALNGFSGQLPLTPTNFGTTFGCSTEIAWHNSHWFRIIPCEQHLQLEFSVFGSQTGDGIQVSIICPNTGGCGDTIDFNLVYNPACAPSTPCNHLNQPAPPGDSCSVAPLFCGNYLEGYCSSNAGAGPDSSFNTNGAPCFSIENNVWLRIPPCSADVKLEITPVNCTNWNGLEAALFSGVCDSLNLVGNCKTLPPNQADTLIFNGLDPTQVYWLMIDGAQGDVCQFGVHVVEGIGTASVPTYDCDCTPGSISGPTSLCPGDVATYTLTLPHCTITPDTIVGGNGYSCAPPVSVCGGAGSSDSTVIIWHIPDAAHFIGDSTGLTITVVVDSSFIGIDTLITDSVWVEINNISIPNNDSTMAQVDSLAFCDCASAVCSSSGAVAPLHVTIRHRVIIDQVYTLTCYQPVVTVNNQSFTNPGVYIVSQNHCETHKVVIQSNFIPPIYSVNLVDNFNGTYSVIVNLFGPEQVVGLPGTQNFYTFTSSPIPCGAAYTFEVINLINGCPAFESGAYQCACQLPAQVNLIAFGNISCCASSVPIQSQITPALAGLTYKWQGPGVTGANTPTVVANQPGLYSLTVTGSGGCIAVASTNVSGSTQPPSVSVNSNQTICIGESATLNATSATQNVFYQWSNGNNSPNISVTPSQTSFYTVTVTNLSNCCTSAAHATVAVNQLAILNKGVVGAVTCGQTCFTYNGQTYCTPGNYQQTANCTQTNFSIVFARDTIQLGVVDTLTCAHNCFTFNGLQYCTVGNYSTQDSCNVYYFTLASGKDTVQLGVVDTLTCSHNCFTFNGLQYCTAGNFSTQDSCNVYYFTLASGKDTVQLGVVDTLTCSHNCFTFNGLQYCTAGNFSTQDSCNVYYFTLASGKDTVQLGVVDTLTCSHNCFTFNGLQYCTAGNFSTQDSCNVYYFTLASGKDTVQLGVVDTLTCAHNCFTFNGIQYCAAGNFSTQDSCNVYYFTLASGKDTVQLGVVDTLTCAHNCFTFNSIQYCTAGNYSTQDSCNVYYFTLASGKDTVQLGVVDTLTCSHNCFTFNGLQYCTAGNFSTQDSCNVYYFTLASGKDTVQLGVVDTLTCSHNCFTFNGLQYCAAGNFSTQDSCNVYYFTLASGKDTVQLGVVDTLTCAHNCFTFNSIQYCTAGNFSTQDSCNVYYFTLASGKDTVQLGVVDTLTCVHNCFTFNGIQYCTAGNYSTQDSCNVYYFSLTENKQQPQISNLLEMCNPSGTAYLVSFQINGLAPFLVNDAPVSGNYFNSSPIVSGDTYAYIVKSAPNGCETTTTGQHNCDYACVATAGQMVHTTLHQCVQESAQGQYLGGAQFGPNDLAQFILHDQSGTTVGLVIAKNQTGNFTFIPGLMQTEQLYYISQIVGKSDGNGNVDLTDPCLSVATGQPLIFHATPTAAISGTAQVCYGETLSLLGSGGTSGFWVMPNNTLINANILNINAKDIIPAADYRFVAGNDFGCRDTAHIEVNVIPEMAKPKLTVHQPPCPDPTPVQGAVEIETGFTNLQFSLDNGPLQSAAQFDQLGVGPHTLTTQDQYGCTRNDSIYIYAPAPLMVDAGPDQTGYPGAAIQLKGAFSGIPVDIQWVASDGQTFSGNLTWDAQFRTSSLVTLFVTDNRGCKAQDELRINIQNGDYWYIPNAIAPESLDGNAYFTVFCAEGYVKNIAGLRIFDRWGNMLFERNGFQPNIPNLGWDGSTGGKYALPGVYVYIVELDLFDGTRKTLNGSLTVVR